MFDNFRWRRKSAAFVRKGFGGNGFVWHQVMGLILDISAKISARVNIGIGTVMGIVIGTFLIAAAISLPLPWIAAELGCMRREAETSPRRRTVRHNYVSWLAAH